MGHSAYDSFELLTNCPKKIEAVASHGTKIFLGCSDGSLLIYVPESSDGDRSPHNDQPETQKEPYVLEKTLNGFSKRPIVAMEVSRSRELLLSLSESIAFHRIPNLETIAVITKAKGANLFSWDDRRGYLCFARQKRVCIFRHDGGRGFVEVKEYGVPDIVKSMSWCGENICIGIRREYMILNTTSGALSEVFPSGRSAPPLVVSLPSGELILGKIRSLRAPYTLVQTVVLRNVHHLIQSNGSLIAAQDNSVYALFPVPIGAQMLQREYETSTSWTPPDLVDLVCLQSVTFLITLDLTNWKLSATTQVAKFESTKMESTMVFTICSARIIDRIIKLEKTRNLIFDFTMDGSKSTGSSKVRSPSSCEIMAGGEESRIDHVSSFSKMRSSPNLISDFVHVKLSGKMVKPFQIVQLTASGNFEEALALCKLLPPEDSNLRAARESSIHIRYGHYLFDNESYEEAMEQFLASQVDVTYVLSLYNSIVLPKSLSIPEPEKIADFAWDSSYLSRASSDASDENDSSSPSQLTEFDKNAALETKKLSYNSLMALVKSKISSKVRGNIHVGSGSREMATILDTALIQALILTGQLSAAIELLRGINYCDAKTCEEFLQQGNHYTALIELYKYNGMHREALNLLNKLIQESKSDQLQFENLQTFGPEMIIEYLKPICNTDPMLVLEFSMLVLESCPTQTIELFLSGNIPADLVNSYLKQHAPSMQGRYLELMLAMNENGISGNLQNEMVQIYLSEVLEWYADLLSKQNWDEKAYSPSRKKLLSALESISGYNPEALLKRLPANALYEERAILLGKMNHHQLALSLYVHKLHVPELALAYCDRVYEAGQRQPHSELYNNIYLTLLQIYINPQKMTKDFEKNIKNLVSPKNVSLQKVGSIKPRGSRVGKKIAEIEGAEEVRFSLSGTDSGRSDGDGDEPVVEETSSIMIDEVLDLLSRRWDRINGAQALKLLPRETKLQVKDELYKLRRTVVKISSDSMCSLCNKKIGASVFAVYPNGKTLVHFVCFRDSQNIRAVVKNSPLRKRG
ncbi:hypothetical protein Syun_005050 [Stephania yunnanensis]|uniref:CNH domain-containing protein n=1 Tax=Stephania yunnanensis TaxID=152371 RepID=A0AAP0L5J8_9MAGN